MARKKETEIKLDKVENIIKELKKKVTLCSEITKFDGITMLFKTKVNKTRDDAKLEVQEICKTLKLFPISIDDIEQDDLRFLVQLPDLVPNYSEEEIDKMFIYNFKWLLDDSTRNKPDITRNFIFNNRETYVRLATTTYYRSNVNRYREKVEDYLGNEEFKKAKTDLFVKYLDEYWEARG